jgi:hypothetical protein
MFLRRWFPSETRNHPLQDSHTMCNKMYGGISENPKPPGKKKATEIRTRCHVVSSCYVACFAFSLSLFLVLSLPFVPDHSLCLHYCLSLTFVSIMLSLSLCHADSSDAQAAS